MTARWYRARTALAAVMLCLPLLAACGSSDNKRSAGATAASGAGTVTGAGEPAPLSGPEPTSMAGLDPESAEGRLLAKPWSGDLDGMMGRRFIRVLVIPDKMNFFFDGRVMRGVTYDAMREFESVVNVKLKTGATPVGLVFVPVRRDEILQALVAGRGDIAAGNLGISADRQRLVDFSDPLRDNVKVIPVGGPDAPPMTRLDDLSGKTVYVPASSVFPGLVASLNERFKKEGKPPVVVQAADENLEPADILEMVNAGIVPMTLSDSVTAEFWAKVFDRLHPYPDLPLVDTGATGWAFRKNSPKLKAIVNDFVGDHRVGTVFGNMVLRKYLASTKWVKNATSESERKKFNEMVGLFRKYGDQYDLPYLLVVAQAYQESALNPKVRSPAGAVGVMQIKPSTAAAKPIEIRNVTRLDKNIEAGTKYLRFLVDQYYKDEPMPRVEQGLFAIASYNAGPTRIRELRRKAAAQSLDPNRWFNNVELVAAQEIGRETVQYVANIYKYYLAYKMLEDTRAAKTGVAATKNSGRQ